MNEKTLKLENIRVKKKEFHKSKQPVDLASVNVYKIVVSGKFKHSDKGFKYFMGYKEGQVFKPLCIILLQMNGYIKYFENGSKNMSLFIRDDEVFYKYNKIWDRVKEKLNVKFHSEPIYDKKYIKAKVREFDDVIKTNVLGNKVQTTRHTYIACVTIDSVVKMYKENSNLFRRMQV